ncbi:MAG: ATP-binding cassette domain-containing protein [Deltaproteobacteria bacterium]|nr:ATP-binding cassette domain-containing protein [Deltaproteobacteria bacterium]
MAGPESENALKLVDVGLRFPGAPAPLLDGFSLRLPRGQVSALVGPSGCGKSTLLRLLAGLLPPDRGAVDLAGLAEAPGARGFVFQAPNLLPWRTVAENVALPLQLAGIDDPAAVDAALDRVGLASARGLHPHALSGGMRMRVSLARALVTRPALLLLDEPFGALDAITRRGLQAAFAEVWSRLETTVVMVTHDVEEAVLMADVVVVLGGAPLSVRAWHAVKRASPRGPAGRFSSAVGDQVRRLEAAL